MKYFKHKLLKECFNHIILKNDVKIYKFKNINSIKFNTAKYIFSNKGKLSNICSML